MSKCKIKVSVRLVECSEETDDNPIELEDGCYQYTIDGDAGESIDNCEIAVLNKAHPAIRDAIARHMEKVSKKKP
ncbi:hypothetical protein [Desulfonatronospira sp.]|uniref:hypothetical protein n=1 Tax=Desulfonatronospira sp. TaxID=1962951 RepID=UPI0025BA6C65|nr:hypothetical protein [Desulfonatronospira sp.]